MEIKQQSTYMGRNNGTTVFYTSRDASEVPSRAIRIERKSQLYRFSGMNLHTEARIEKELKEGPVYVWES